MSHRESIARFAQEYFLNSNDLMNTFEDLRYHVVLLPPDLSQQGKTTPSIIVRKQGKDDIGILESSEVMNLFQRITQYGGYIDKKLWKYHNPHHHSLDSVITQLNEALKPVSPNKPFMQDRVFPCGYAYRRDHTLRHTLLRNRIKDFYNYRKLMQHEEDILTFSNPITSPDGNQIELLVGKTHLLQEHMPHPRVDINPDFPFFLIMTTNKKYEQFGQWNEQTVFMEINHDERTLFRRFSPEGIIDISSHEHQQKGLKDTFKSWISRMHHFGYVWTSDTGVVSNDTIFLPHITR